MSLSLEERQANIAAGSISGRFRPLPPLSIRFAVSWAVLMTINSYGWQVYESCQTGQPWLSETEGPWLMWLVGKRFLYYLFALFVGFRVLNWLRVRW